MNDLAAAERQPSQSSRRRIQWIALALLGLTGAWIAQRFFPIAFPIVALELRMDRDEALRQTSVVAERIGFDLSGYEQAASFNLDGRIRNYVELEGGGGGAFRDLLTDDAISPYTWRVRSFREGQIGELTVLFRPNGDFYSYREKLPDAQPGAALSEEDAQRLAIESATGWGVDLGAYELVEAAEETRTTGRIDHSFVYEQPQQKIGDARVRLRLTIGGGRLIALERYLQIPEGFDRRYREMRSTNNFIALLGSVGMLLFLSGGSFGLFVLLRQRRVLWRQPLIAAAAVATLQLAAGINDLPLAWMAYDTAVAKAAFLSQQLTFVVLSTLSQGLLYALSFILAENLTRKAFPQHLQLWKTWSDSARRSTFLLKRTVVGYLLLGVDLGFLVLFYLVTTRLLGWWSPSDTMVDPNALATPLPWLTPLAASLQAATWEECLFRAVPIAGATVLGRRLGRPRLWLFSALVLQALVFGAGHANYATQPGYARLVELLGPSLLFAVLYYRFGLYVSILLHYLFDIVLIGLPVFASRASGVWIDQALLLLFALVPAGAVLTAALRRGILTAPPTAELNGAWEPPPIARETQAATTRAPASPLGLAIPTALVLLSLPSLWLWMALKKPPDTPAVDLRRSDAVRAASDYLAIRGVELGPEWRTLVWLDASPGAADELVWRQRGAEGYHELLGRYLDPPHWWVRRARFEGDDVAALAEEHWVFIAPSGDVSRYRHRLPEEQEGLRLERQEAEPLVRTHALRTYDLDLRDLEEVAVEPSQLPNRRDWKFVYRDGQAFQAGGSEARLEIDVAGDRIVDSHRSIFVDEEWQRQQRQERLPWQITNLIASIALTLGAVVGFVTAVVSWSRGRFRRGTFLAILVGLLSIELLLRVNAWPTVFARFSTAEPLWTQRLAACLEGAVSALVLPTTLALVAGCTRAWLPRQAREGFGRSLAAAYGLACLALVVIEAGHLLGPSFPLWADYNGADHRLPALTEALVAVRGTLLLFVATTAALTLIDELTASWSRRRRRTTVWVGASSFCLAAATARNWQELVFSTLALSTFVLATYIIVGRRHLSATLLGLAVLPLSEEVVKLLTPPFRGARLGALIGATAVTVAALTLAHPLTSRPSRRTTAAH